MGKWTREARLQRRKAYGATRICSKCGTEKIVDDFPVGAGWCHICYREATRANRALRTRSDLKAAREKRKDKVQAYYRQWYRECGRTRNPLAQAAQSVVQQAVKKGILTRPLSCMKCGETNSRIEAHHYNYSYPLNVMWLCSSCHRREHRVRLPAG